MQYQPLFSDKKIIKFKVNLKKIINLSYAIHRVCLTDDNGSIIPLYKP